MFYEDDDDDDDKIENDKNGPITYVSIYTQLVDTRSLRYFRTARV